jgi:hypothetical protein
LICSGEEPYEVLVGAMTSKDVEVQSAIVTFLNDLIMNTESMNKLCITTFTYK